MSLQTIFYYMRPQNASLFFTKIFERGKFARLSSAQMAHLICPVSPSSSAAHSLAFRGVKGWGVVSLYVPGEVLPYMMAVPYVR